MASLRKLKFLIIQICFSTKKYYVASFEYDFEYEDDLVYFAYCIPYTYSNLLVFLRELSVTQRTLYNKGEFLE